jgi:hypothetical protein
METTFKSSVLAGEDDFGHIETPAAGLKIHARRKMKLPPGGVEAGSAA